MTTPTLTYGHAFLEDFIGATVSTNWLRTAGAPDLASATLTSSNLDYGVIAVTAEDNGDNCYWTWNVDIEKSTTTYTKILIRYRTSVAATGLGFKVEAIFSDTSTQWIVGDAGTTAYSTDFTTVSVTLNPTAPGADLDHIRLYAISETAACTHTITIDFILVYRTEFQFPQLTGGIEQEFQNQYGRIQIPGRKGNITQYLGSSDSPFHIFGDICYEDSATYPAGSPSWRDGSASRAYLIYGQFLRQLIDEADMEPWQWLTSDIAECKVTVDHATISEVNTNDDIYHFDMTLYEYRQSGTSSESYLERWGLL